VGDELGLTIANVFHAGDGNLHPCILFDERKPGDVRKVIEAGHRILQACIDAGGALSGEHGIGIEKQAYMPMVFTPEDLEAMARLRPAFGQVIESPSPQSSPIEGEGTKTPPLPAGEGQGEGEGSARPRTALRPFDTAQSEKPRRPSRVSSPLEGERNKNSSPSQGEDSGGGRKRRSRFNPGKVFPGGAVHGEWHEQPPEHAAGFQARRTGGNEVV
jgi:hypothetical protein